LNELLAAEEQNTATLQQELLQRDKQVRELRETLATKDKEIYTTDNDKVSIPQQAGSLESSKKRAKPSENPINMKWKSLPNAPTRMRAGSSAVIGYRVYIRPDSSQTIHEFNFHNQQWSTLPKHPIENFTIVNVENKLITVGGEEFILYSNKLYSYEDGKWIEDLPPMPTKRWTPGAVYTNKTLLVVGGVNGGWLSTVEILNTTSRLWSSVSSLPFTTDQPSICIHSDHIYIHQGITSTYSEQHSVYKCSVATLVQSRLKSRVWKRIASLPVRYSTLTSAC